MAEQTYSRQVVLDTETTGMNQAGGPIYQGHKIIEIGCVEVINRRLTGRHYHVYVNPGRAVDEEAFQVHGISDEFLRDKPTFAQVASEFVEFIQGAELVIHNAPFDVSFMDYEFDMLGQGIPKTSEMSGILDTLVMAKQMHPGQRNSLDALCKRYGIDNSSRELHGALLDAEILADVYLAMTGGQTSLNLANEAENDGDGAAIQAVNPALALKVLAATESELNAHTERLELVKSKGGQCLWLGEPQE
ncbi:DNA polymerase III subunit epsilon [Psychrobium sp. 1_MG-2023]|uniref:DNA polymerase III subunit epsilon n=1 Tax=Psychrobium sp. 1_MG-2023 TaxID=3062624 RepID=UPI000C33CE65|nr:DNA polymerase III subunit epsilon [Psychrobium sp. 1_MG-2023]MDP2560636.1 DNA polymerase III subunit epsilon [Psychrobium sp. 1_MG-2023]PKF57621.1 DNA polymerase III subunit epsilon [Alteromonadales bacterium alter-6D02]